MEQSECPYCHGEKSFIFYKRGRIYLQGDMLIVDFWNGGRYRTMDSDFVEINYCPVCGRKLRRALNTNEVNK